MAIIAEIKADMDVVCDIERSCPLSEQTQTEIKYINDTLMNVINQHIPIKRHDLNLQGSVTILEGIEEKLQDNDIQTLKNAHITIRGVMEKYRGWLLNA